MSDQNLSDPSPLPAELRDLSGRLRWLRKQRGLTQVEVSSALGCEQAMVSSWEVGRTRPSAIALGALGRFYQVSIPALGTGEGFTREADESSACSQKRTATNKNSPNLLIQFPQARPGQLLVVDAVTGNSDLTDSAEGMAKLLHALKKGRQAWIVIK
jgi:transcriptional regulator with XRE-family HTH domain